MELLAVPGTSGREREVVELIDERLRRAGAPKEAIHLDQAHQRSPHRGEIGNLVLRLPGTQPGGRRLLMAHVDTVPLCEGARPVRRGRWIVPERGVSAITIASLAIAQLHHDGWLGKVEKPEGVGTANIGVIRGGEATNVVTPTVELWAEARSHIPAFRQKIVQAIEEAFSRAALSVRSDAGAQGEVEFDGRLDYEAFRLADDDPSLLAAEEAIRALGGEPLRAISNGGLDANWMTARGIPTVSLGTGQENPHTASERLDRSEFFKACHIALRLATAPLATGTQVR